MHCPSCGTQNPDTAAFCNNCGTGLKNTGQSASAQRQKPRGPGLGLVAVLIAVMAVLLAGTGVLLYFVLSGSAPVFGGTASRGDVSQTAAVSTATPAPAELDVLGTWYSRSLYHLTFYEGGFVTMDTTYGVQLKGEYVFDAATGEGSLTLHYNDESETTPFHVEIFSWDGSSNLLIGEYWFDRDYTALGNSSIDWEMPGISFFSFTPYS